MQMGVTQLLIILPVFRSSFLLSIFRSLDRVMIPLQGAFTHKDLMIMSQFFLLQWSVLIRGSQKCISIYFRKQGDSYFKTGFGS